jgi:hypothetical protein
MDGDSKDFKSVFNIFFKKNIYIFRYLILWVLFYFN